MKKLQCIRLNLIFIEIMKTWKIKKAIKISRLRKAEVHLKTKCMVQCTKNEVFFSKGFFSKSDQICRKLKSWSHLLKKFVMENLIFCSVVLFSVCFPSGFPRDSSRWIKVAIWKEWWLVILLSRMKRNLKKWE